MVEPRTHIIDDGSLHRYRTEIPNTIIRGIRGKDLSRDACWLYVYLKSVAGDAGECWQRTKTLASGAKMSMGLTSKAKAELVHAGLIRLIPGDQSRHISDKIRIVDIWDENMREFSGSPHETELESQSLVIKQEIPSRLHHMKPNVISVSPDERAVSPHERGSVSPHEPKKIPIIGVKKIPKKEERAPGVLQKHPVAAPRSRFLPDDFTITAELRQWAQGEVPHVNIETETAKMRDHEYAKPHSDWNRAWRRWMRNAVTFGHEASRTSLHRSGVVI